MSCCKVKIEPSTDENVSVFNKLIKNFWAFIGSMILLTIAFPFLYVFCVYFIVSSFVLNKNNKMSDFIRVLKVNLLKIRKSEDMELDDENEEDVFEEFVKNPNNFKIVGLDETDTNKD